MDVTIRSKRLHVNAIAALLLSEKADDNAKIYVSTSSGTSKIDFPWKSNTTLFCRYIFYFSYATY